MEPNRFKDLLTMPTKRPCDDLDLINGLAIIVLNERVGALGPNGFCLMGVLFLGPCSWTYRLGIKPMIVGWRQEAGESAIALTNNHPSSREEMDTIGEMVGTHLL